jgi:uncharacterized membrane protein
MRRWLSRSQDEQGTVLVLLAITMTVLIGSTALAVDIGQMTNNNRTLQATADVIALDTARVLNGQTVAQLQSSATAAAQASALRNSFPWAKLTVDLGSKTATTTFVRQDPTISPTAVPNAARVIASGSVKFAFNPGSGSTSRTAVAVQENSAGFSIGSFLVGTTGAHDTVLNKIFGDSFSAQVVSYNGLAAANVTTSLRKIGLNMPVTALSPTQLLSTSVSAKNLMLASAAALNDGSHAAAVSVLNALAASVTTTTMVKLGDTIKVQAGGEAAAADAEMNVLQMLTASAFFVDGTHAITIPEAQVGLAGFGDITLSLDVITPAQTRYGPVGTTASNTQVHLTVTPQLHVSTAPSVNTCGLRSTLGLLLSLNVSEILQCTLGNIVSKVITLDLNAAIPIDITAAGASATLSNINCTANPQTITLSPTINPLTVNANIDMTLTATLTGNSLGNVLRVRGDAGVVSQSTPAAETFQNPGQFGTPRTVTSNALSLAGLTNLTVSDATLLNANLGPVSSVIAAAAVVPINAAFSALDTGLITPLIHRLGLGIGGADLTALTGSLICNGLRLAE